jgi:hypothetical protein
MHSKLHERHEREEQIAADEEALAKVDATIASHVTPNLVSCWHRSGAGPQGPTARMLSGGRCPRARPARPGRALF